MYTHNICIHIPPVKLEVLRCKVCAYICINACEKFAIRIRQRVYTHFYSRTHIYNSKHTFHLSRCVFIFLLVLLVKCLIVIFHSFCSWVALALVIVCLIAMACCPDVRRTAPTNFIFLFIFTLAQSFLLGIVTSVYDVSEVHFNSFKET